MNVYYDRAATLRVIPRPEQIVNGRVTYANTVYDGTLAGAVKRFMAIPKDDYLDASIGFDVGVIEGNTTGLIGPTEIREIYAREDFPD